MTSLLKTLQRNQDFCQMHTGVTMVVAAGNRQQHAKMLFAQTLALRTFLM